MMDKSTNNKVITHNIISWLFAVIFFILGVLNLIFVHPVPGIFYVLLSLIYAPITNVFLIKRFNFKITLWLKIITGLIILWGTLAVGDLMEMFEAWVLR